MWTDVAGAPAWFNSALSLEELGVLASGALRTRLLLEQDIKLINMDLNGDLEDFQYQVLRRPFRSIDEDRTDALKLHEAFMGAKEARGHCFSLLRRDHTPDLRPSFVDYRQAGSLLVTDSQRSVLWGAPGLSRSLQVCPGFSL